MSSIYVEDTNNNRENINLFHGFKSALLVYSDNQSTNQNSWNSQSNLILIFKAKKLKITDINNIKLSLYWIADFIKNYTLKNNREKNILYLKGFGQAAYSLVSAMFEILYYF